MPENLTGDRWNVGFIVLAPIPKLRTLKKIEMVRSRDLMAKASHTVVGSDTFASPNSFPLPAPKTGAPGVATGEIGVVVSTVRGWITGFRLT